ncbi:MAG: TlpA family protein disulfide reductase [Acidobacteria bacterium]|nr:TlpA family protein disulfide reductase [Acidobacteriota bacterium]
MIFGVVTVVLVTLVVLTFDSGDTSSETGSPAITGETLPMLPGGGSDPAVGMLAPEVSGTDFDGSPVPMTNDGRAKVILFVAHWCPHCQREVPIIQDWLDSTTLPENVDFYTISTSVSSTRENYPPSAWLEREGWTAPVILDDATSSVSNAFGLTAFPYWVFTSADGTVMARVTGGVAPSDLDVAVATIQEQATG